MLRILAAIAIVIFLVCFSIWREDNPPQDITTPNAGSEKVKEFVAGDAIRAKERAEKMVDDINKQQREKLRELDQF